MVNSVTLSCPTCGQQLIIEEDVERFACAGCGREHVVRRAGGLVRLLPAAEGPERAAAQQEIERLTAEIQSLRDALWNGKIGRDPLTRYPLFVLLCDIHVKRYGPKPKTFLGLRSEPFTGEEMHNILYSLTISELDWLLASPKIADEQIRASLIQLRHYEEEIAEARRRLRSLG